MPKSKPLHEEIIEEIGTQTLARFGLNIFSLNTYNAYSASVVSTNIVFDAYDRHKNNDKYFGHMFEYLDVGQQNIYSELSNKSNKTFTTDELADIKNVADILASGKKIEKLNSKDRKKFDFVMNNYSDYVKKINSIPNMRNNANKNDTSTDVITFDSKGNIIQKSQHKVIKDTRGFFEKEKLYDKTGKILKDKDGKTLYKKDKDGSFVYKYLTNNDIFTVPFDDYKKHKKNLENIIKNPINNEEKQVAQKTLDMLNKNNITNRIMCENPKTTAVVTQSLMASGHIAQAGMSDAVIVSLSMLANGIVFEIKDAFSVENPDISVSKRMKRLLKKVLESFGEPFSRGASFGAIDTGVGILSQIFKSISLKLKFIWTELRTSLKSIYNAIWDFIKGKINSYQELISIIIKGIFSAIMVAFSVALETDLEVFLSPLVSPIVASFLSPALSISISALAIIMMTKSIDLSLNTLFGLIAQKDISKMKASDVHDLCENMMPLLIEDAKELERLISSTYQERKLTYNQSFYDFKKGILSNDIEKVISGLENLNSLYGKNLTFKTFKEFDDCMLNKDSIIKL